ncbi:hypothetical protein D3260_06565 [Salinisphaera sp. Q1T1-3]|nr:hypothetical protein D3260_06565 [Salinisphaera sp. Q1T1-3]
MLLQPLATPALLPYPVTVDGIEHWLYEQGLLKNGLSPGRGDWRAFYGDSQLRDFFYQRLRWHARAGHIDTWNAPRWHDGQGTISAAMVHDTDAELFERMTGMPYAFACVLEFLDVATRDQIDQLFDVLEPGCKLRDVAINLFSAWLAAPELPWAELINDSHIDGLRRQWLTLDAQRRRGEIVPAGEWRELRLAASHMVSGDDPYRTLQRHVAELIMCASPPPADDAHRAWRHLLLGLGSYAKVSMVRFLHGWRHQDFAMEMLLFRWFSEREAREPGGRFTPETLQQAQREWEAQPQDQEYIAREEAFHENARVWLSTFDHDWWLYLLRLLREAPV